jgi:CRISPR/Cas system CSM-associated protein Csm3 (group 7 of RAMP superfamily)
MKRFMAIYRFLLISTGPLHIGDDDGELLIEENSGRAVLPGTSFIGVLKAYAKKNEEEQLVSELFGSDRPADQKIASSLKIRDMVSKEQAAIEYRPSVRIDGRFGSADDQGKFEHVFVAAGTRFQGEFYVSAETEKQSEQFHQIACNCIAAINHGFIRFGAYKGIGGGLMKAENFRYSIYDLFKIDDFFLLFSRKDEQEKMSRFEDINLPEAAGKQEYKFSLSVRFDAPMLIRGDASVEQSLDDTASKHLDAAPIRSSDGKYIIPGSSWRGVLRHQMERILGYYGQTSLLDDIFGNSGDKNPSSGKIYVSDALITSDRSADYYGIHIDKLTGGVMKGALRQERTVWGRALFQLNLAEERQEKAEKAAGAILLGLRDIAEGSVNLGSHSSGGFGYLRGESLTVRSPEGAVSVDFRRQSVENKALVDRWLARLQGGKANEVV